MAEKTFNTRIRLRNDVTANWEEKNPQLGKGEVGIEICTDGTTKIKIGDGIEKWTTLKYTYDPEAIQSAIDEASRAENLYFENDLVFTEAFGKYKPGTSGNVTIPTATNDMSMADLLNTAFATESDPTTVAPTLSLATSGNKSGEVGTTWERPSATATVTTGSFSFGSVDASGNKYTKEQGTGVTFSEISVTCGTASKSQTASNAAVTLALTTTEIPDGSAVYSDAGSSYSFTASASYPAATRYPVTNLGSRAASKYEITAGTLTKSATVTYTGYRCWFLYVGTDCTTTVDSAFVRSTTNKGNAASASNLSNVAIAAGTKRVMVALPVASKKTLTSVIDVDGMGLDVIGNFTESVVSVNGANGAAAVDYRVYVAENANGLAATKYNFVIG